MKVFIFNKKATCYAQLMNLSFGNRPFPSSSKNPHFLNNAKCKTFHAEMSFIFMGLKHHFHNTFYPDYKQACGSSLMVLLFSFAFGSFPVQSNFSSRTTFYMDTFLLHTVSWSRRYQTSYTSAVHT